MLEPGDIEVDYKPLYPRPNIPDAPVILQGIPQFKGRYDETQRKNVGDTYEETIRMNGERDIEIEFAEQNPYDTSRWTVLKRFTIDDRTAGFQLHFQVKRTHNAGLHHLRYTATNSKGKGILDRKLIINQRTVGG